MARFLLLLLFVTLTAPVQSADVPADTQRQLLAKEQEAVERFEQENDDALERQRTRLKRLAPAEVTPLMIEQAGLDLEEARVRLESAEVDLQATRHQMRELDAAIHEAESRQQQIKVGEAPQARQRDDELQANLAEQRSQKALESRREAIRETAVAAARERLALAEEWHRSLQDLRRAAVEETKRSELDGLKTRLENEQQRWLAKAAGWRKTLQGLDESDTGRRSLLTARIHEAEERARLAVQQIRFAQIASQLDRFEAAPPDMADDPPVIKDALDQMLATRDELQASGSLLRKRLDVLRQQEDVTAKKLAAGDRSASPEERLVYGRLEQVLAGQLEETDHLLRRIGDAPEKLRSAYDRSFRRGLLVRRPLPVDPAGWAGLRDALAAFPSAIADHVVETGRALVQPVGTFTPDRWLLLVMAQALWIGLAWRTRRGLDRTRPATGSFAAELTAVPIRLVRRSMNGAMGLGMLLILFAFTAPPDPAADTLITLLTVGGGAWLAGNLAWVLLMSPEAPEPRRHPRLYRQLKWMVTAVAALAFVTYTAHTLASGTTLVNLLDRLFMVALLLFTIPALEARRFVLELMEQRLGERYWTRVARLLSLLAPLAVLATASVGLAGYVNLARAIGTALAAALVALGAWLILARLLREGADAAKNWVNLNTSHGLLLAKGVIEPVNTVAQLLLFALLCWLPLHAYGIGPETPAVAAVHTVLIKPLFSLGETAVTPARLTAMALGLIAVVRLGRWFRLVTYRWALSGVSDEGVRHSLSVFTQYTVVFGGLLFTLHLAGIDLTTLAIFAGALGVGIGFGLQNIANNFISGILLLAERPLRTHDIVSVGQHEGEVTHIGMRSITVKTWDNQEVIMPNSDVIGSAFTNWTHHDHIVRTVINVRTGYEVDPKRVVRLLESVLADHGEVLAEPEPCVWLQEFGDSSLVFHIQYFTDLRGSVRLQVRSDVLMRIWEALHRAGIRIPHPRVEVRWPDEDGAAPEFLPHPVKSGPMRASG